MFKNILQIWKGKDFLNHVLEDFNGMLDDTEEMFLLVCKKLIHNEGGEDIKDKIYSIDRKVNALEKDIRKRVLEHLVVQPSVDLSTSLLFMSVVKDAERLGDYAKNLYEVTNLLEKPIDINKCKELFNDIEGELAELFKQTKKAFIESDEDTAAKSWESKREIGTRCEAIIVTLSKSVLSVNEAVCFTLMARHFKRIASHLTNIATSVILPLSELDYFDERRQG